MHKSKLLIALIAGVSASFPAAALITYEWVDDNGDRHIESTCSPECARKEHWKRDSVTKQKTKIPGWISSEDRLSNEQANAKKRADEEAVLESKRRDKALVNTYSNPAEIDRKRNRDLQLIDVRVNGASAQVKIINDSLLGLQKEADVYKQAGKALPESLRQDMTATQARLTKQQQALDKAKAEKSAMEARYDADKARYKELTGK